MAEVVTDHRPGLFEQLPAPAIGGPRWFATSPLENCGDRAEVKARIVEADSRA
jgi:hypothetical protein